MLQPLLLVFVFTYVFPKIGQGVGGSGAGAATFSSVLVAGVVATAIIFQGIQAVALPLVQELLGYTREIEDRVLAPLPVAMVVFEKIVAGALQCLVAGSDRVPDRCRRAGGPTCTSTCQLAIVLTLIPIGCIMSGALGLMSGAMFDPRSVPMLFAVVLIPITFLGSTYDNWQALRSDPLAPDRRVRRTRSCTSGGGVPRARSDTGAAHEHLFVVYGVLIGAAVLFTYVGLRGGARRDRLIVRSRGGQRTGRARP